MVFADKSPAAGGRSIVASEAVGLALGRVHSIFGMILQIKLMPS